MSGDAPAISSAADRAWELRVQGRLPHHARDIIDPGTVNIVHRSCRRKGSYRPGNTVDAIT